MECGYEALPPRVSGRSVKRRRTPAGPPPVDSSPSADAPPSSGTDAPVAAALLPYDGVVSGMTYEYLDHTADVQIHSWATSLEEAYVQAALGMYGYMTEPDSVSIDEACSRVIEARGHDLASLLFNFLDACLYAFASDDFVAKDMRPLGPVEAPAAAPAAAPAEVGTVRGAGDGVYRLRAAAWGERFSLSKHPQGTEVKAITYSAMQIFTPTGVYTSGSDAAAAAPAPTAEGGSLTAGGAAPAEAAAAPAPAAVRSNDESDGGAVGRRRGAFDVYVIVDI